MLRFACSLGVLFTATGVLCGCGSAGSVAATSTTTSTTTTTTSSSTNTGLDKTQLPLGDGKYSATAQTVGNIYVCSATFNGKGATGTPPWINTSASTYDFTAKTSVQGSVAWPAHAYTITLSGSSRIVSTNDLPNHNTGVFPIASTDPAYQYDGNPNSIAAQNILYTLPANPTAGASPGCIGGGPIGVLLTGALLFDGLDAEGRDAVAHEVQDTCQGHPQETDEYHYHSITSCIDDPGTGHSNLLGYAADGFGIYGVRGENGAVLTNADLDACHGHMHAITWDGQTVTMYHYHATYEYPYTIGCFHGTAVKTNVQVAVHDHHHGEEVEAHHSPAVVPWLDGDER
jgi:YHYH protein